MAKEKQDDQEHVFVTEDKAVREAGGVSKADAEILQSVQTGEGLITIKSVEELKEMAKAAAYLLAFCPLPKQHHLCILH